MKKKSVSFILFGGTGDLTKKKLAPAFAQLVHDKEVASNSSLVGIARKKFTDEEYKNFLMKSVPDKKERKHISEFDVGYVSGDFDSDELYASLKKELKEKEPKQGCGRIIYFATGFEFFSKIISKLKKHGLHKNKKYFTRVVFEKPFGKGYLSALSLDKKIHSVFPEKNVFRIDHYLAKGMVQNINVLKYLNPIIYGTLSNKYISSIEVIADEDFGVGKRIEYYDSAGAVRDMIQNHLLQILGRILMEKPKTFNYEDYHREKIKVLKNLEVMPAKNHLFGQYKDYGKELERKGLSRSKTETFARVELNCKTKRWDGVKLILRTGKNLKEKKGMAIINYKSESKAQNKWNCFEGNKIVLDLFPKQDITIVMNTRDPRKEGVARPVSFEFCNDCEFGPNSVDAYSVLLREVIEGDKYLFAKNDTVLESWKVVEKIERLREKIKFVKYSKGLDPEKI